MPSVRADFPSQPTRAAKSPETIGETLGVNVAFNAPRGPSKKTSLRDCDSTSFSGVFPECQITFAYGTCADDSDGPLCEGCSFHFRQVVFLSEWIELFDYLLQCLRTIGFDVHEQI